MSNGSTHSFNEEREKSILFCELVGHMNSLLTLIASSSCEGKQYVLLIPPNRDVERFVTGFSMRTRGSKQRIIRRISQSVVRRHLLHGSSFDEMFTFTGDAVRIEFTLCHGEDATDAPFLGFVCLLRPGRPPLQLGIRGSENYGTSGNFCLLFVSGALLESEAAVSVSASPSMSINGGQNYVWSRLQKPNFSGEVSLLQQFKNDENVLRTFLEGIPLQKKDAGCEGMELQKQLDDAFLFVETEVGIMSSSYVCMLGYEPLIVAKVLQISTAGADAVSCFFVDLEREKEDVLVAFHAVVTGALSHKLVPHWDDLMNRENVAFSHACNKLKQAYPFQHFLPSLLGKLPVSSFLAEIELIRVLDATSLSVLSFMRAMDCTLGLLMEALTRYGCHEDSTADNCISFLCALIIAATPAFLPARIRYIRDFSLFVMDVSSMGYASTTFEAAATQIMEEYRLHVCSE
ncbi:hypothetical protein TCSYLVIO_007230 [Trypanosoma cruzi]|nr:hypothetical protein TCSYLVIO_007230 [Trypanosoma cruzi]